jgi:hypothetical protein
MCVTIEMREQQATELFSNATGTCSSWIIVYLSIDYSCHKHVAENISYYVLQLLMTAVLCCSAACTCIHTQALSNSTDIRS